MPKRTDLKSILIIGAGPIIIGQACEFDYSGVQACKACCARASVILINSNPATIMTDPEMADVTYIEPITWRRSKRSSPKTPDAILPTMGGQTALNTALDLPATACSTSTGRADRCHARSDRQGRRPPEVGDAMTKIGLGPPLPASPSMDEGLGGAETRRLPGHPPVASRWAARAAASPTTRRVRDHRKRGLEPVAHQRAADRRIAARLERVRDGGGARQGGQLHHHLLHREPGPDGCTPATHHRGPGADADRQEYQIMRDAAWRCCARSAWTPGGSNVQFSVNPKDGRMIVIEMNPASRSSALASKATGFPIAKVAAKLAVGYTAGRAQERHHRRQDAGIVRAPSTTWSPRSRVSPSKIPGRQPPDHADESRWAR